MQFGHRVYFSFASKTAGSSAIVTPARLAGGSVTCAALCYLAHESPLHAKKAPGLRLVTYNVLSDSLDAPSHYNLCGTPRARAHDARACGTSVCA